MQSTCVRVPDAGCWDERQRTATVPAQPLLDHTATAHFVRQLLEDAHAPPARQTSHTVWTGSGWHVGLCALFCAPALKRLVLC